MKVEREITIEAPPVEVYDLVMDPQRLGDWVTVHHALEEAPDGSLRKGSRLTQRLRLAGRTFTVRWTVVENEPARLVVWEGRGPVHTHASVRYGFKPNGDGTRFSYTNEYDLPGGPLGRLAGHAVAGAARKEADASLERLKRLLE